MTEEIDELRAKLLTETGKLSWPELERHFARGVVIKVAKGLDLIDVAARIAEDDKATVENWMASGQLSNASMEDARLWVESEPVFWSVVAAPWVLVQEAERDYDA